VNIEMGAILADQRPFSHDALTAREISVMLRPK
jgi:hypothetical protein